MTATRMLHTARCERSVRAPWYVGSIATTSISLLPEYQNLEVFSKCPRKITYVYSGVCLRMYEY